MLKHMQRSTTNGMTDLLQNNRFTYELPPWISMLSLPHRFVNCENKTKKKKKKKKRNQRHFFKKQTKLTGKLRK